MRFSSTIPVSETVRPPAKGYSFEVDYWSLGVLVYELITGGRPFATTIQDEYGLERTIDVHQQTLDMSYVTNQIGDIEIVVDFITRLLHKDPSQRLGYTNGIEEIKNHPFFEGYGWSHVRQRRYNPTFKPFLASDDDTRYFHFEETSTMVEPHIRHQNFNELFQGTSSTNTPQLLAIYDQRL